MKNKTRLARQLLAQFAVTLFITTTSLLLIALGGRYFLGRITWYSDSPYYQVLHFVNNHLLALLIMTGAIIWLGLTFFFLYRATSYLDEVLLATKQILAEPTKNVLLSPNLQEFAGEINQIRQDSLDNQQAAKTAEQKKNDLIVYLAHDLRTPLTSIIGYLTLLQESPELTLDLRSKYTGIALDKAYRLESLLGEFFEITRFNLSQLSLLQKATDLSLMVEQFAFEFTPILQEKELTWQLAIEKNLHVMLDSEKFARVLDNLIKNAVNYAEKKTVVRLSLVQQQDTVRLTLDNAGVTLDQAKLDRIFEPFFRGDEARRTGTGGTGLGLSIAKQIVELHHGTLQAESTNHHFTLLLTLPIITTKDLEA